MDFCANAVNTITAAPGPTTDATNVLRPVTKPDQAIQSGVMDRFI